MKNRIQPLFLNNNPGNVVFSWIGVLGNATIVLWGLGWLATGYESVAAKWHHLVVGVFLGLFLLDWFSGLVHWTYDTWFDEHVPSFQRSISIAREHHVLPYHIVGYGFRDHVSYSAWPAFVFVGPIGVALSLWAPLTLVAYLGVMLCTLVCLGMFFGSHCHLLGHQPAKWRLIQFLQRTHFLITPAYHRVHHGGNHDTRYAVINGWSNVICDRIGFWRGLERLIQALTAARPRKSDHEWMARFGRR